MKARVARKVLKRVIVVLVAAMLLFFIGIFLLARFYVEPTLRERLHTLIVEGSDSLYTYSLGNLRTNVFGGNITATDFQMRVDSARYRELQRRKELPSMVASVNVRRATIKSLSVFSLLFSKKIYVQEISTDQADVNLLRNFQKDDSSTAVTRNKQPLWKLLQPKIKDLAVDKIRLDGIRLLYQNSEDHDAARLQFERCDAAFENIRIDSAAIADTARIVYVKNFSLRFQNVSARSPDSLYQTVTKALTYDSKARYLEVDGFSLKPTLNKDQRIDSFRKSWYTVSFDKVSFNGLRLDRYLRLNRVEADSVIFQSPKLAVYQDKAGVKDYASKIGKYPHQLLLKATAVVDIRTFAAHNMAVTVTEKHPLTRREGTLQLAGLEVAVHNVVNDKALIRRDPVATAAASGTLIGSPVEASFRFYLDSAEGEFEAKGRLRNIKAEQINSLSSTLANVEVPSADIQAVDFTVRGEDYEATADVRMQYTNLSIVLLKLNKETGNSSTDNFLTKLLNRFAIYASNPASGNERRAQNARVSRLTTQSFFGVIWKAVFAGMQDIILKG